MRVRWIVLLPLTLAAGPWLPATTSPRLEKTVEELIVDLRGDEIGAHQRAQIELARRDPGELGPLVDLFCSDDENEANRARRALVWLGGGAVPLLIDLLGRTDPTVRSRAASALAEIGPEACAAVVPLADALVRDEATGAADARRALERLAPCAAPAFETVVRLLRKSSVHSRQNRALAVSILEAAIRSLPEAARQAEIEDVVGLLSNDDARVQQTAVEAISRLGPMAVAAVPELVKLLEGPSDFMHYSTIVALRNIGPGAVAAVGPLEAVLEDEQGRIRRHVVRALGRIGSASEETIDVLISQLDDGKGDAASACVEALGSLDPGPVKAVDALVALLQRRKIVSVDGQRVDLSAEAGKVLAKMGTPAVDAVLRALDTPESSGSDPQALLRVLALMELDLERALPLLEQYLTGDSRRYRGQACHVLSRIGPPALPVLLAATESEIADLHSKAITSAAWIVIKHDDVDAEEVVAAAVRGCEDASLAVRRQAVWALANMDVRLTDDIETALFDQLEQEDSRIAYTAVLGLMRRGSRDPEWKAVMAEYIDGVRRASGRAAEKVVDHYDETGLEKDELYEKALASFLAPLHDNSGRWLDQAALYQMSQDPALGAAVPEILRAVSAPTRRRRLESTLEVLKLDVAALKVIEIIARRFTKSRETTMRRRTYEALLAISVESEGALERTERLLDDQAWLLARWTSEFRTELSAAIRAASTEEKAQKPKL